MDHSHPTVGPTPGHEAPGPLQLGQTQVHAGEKYRLSFLSQHLLRLPRPHRPRTQDTGPGTPHEGRAPGVSGKLLLCPVAAWVLGRRPRLGAGVPNITQGSVCVTGNIGRLPGVPCDTRARPRLPQDRGRSLARKHVLRADLPDCTVTGRWLSLAPREHVLAGPVPRPASGSHTLTHTHATSHDRSPRSQTRCQSPARCRLAAAPFSSVHLPHPQKQWSPLPN